MVPYHRRLFLVRRLVRVAVASETTMHAVPKHKALSYLAIGFLASAALVASWQWGRSRYELPALFSGSGIVLFILMLPAFIGFGHVARSFSIPPRFGVVVLGFIMLANAGVITFSLANSLPSVKAVITLTLVWAIAGVAAIFLSRAWRAGGRSRQQAGVPSE